ncbi:CRISPR-associated endoribonuclease Cas6 [Moorellaceae bacterium AZ2]
MRVKVKLRTTGGRTFFVSHEQLQQGLTALVYEVFKAADPTFAAWLHDKGWKKGDTPRFKLFSYSRLFASPRVVNEQGIFFGSPEAHFYLSSPDPRVVATFSAGAVAVPTLSLGGTELYVAAVEPLRAPDTRQNRLDVTTLSPFIISDSRSSPSAPYRFLLLEREPDLVCRRLVENARLKWVCYGGDPEAFSLQIAPVDGKDKFVYHASAAYSFPCNEGTLRLEGPSEVLTFLYDTGLGERTGMGYGCLGLYKGGKAA